jgi:SAM-dependent methyltransferase
MITFRRSYLDHWLDQRKNLLKGNVLDLGGKRLNRRGEFAPPLESVTSWVYLNSDSATGPSVVADAHLLPFREKSFDCVLMCEVLEHVTDPHKVLQQILTVLREGGITLISVPFLVGVHADPDDFQRWTARMLTSRLEECGLEVIELSAMGGWWAVTADLLRLLTENHSDKLGFVHVRLGKIVVKFMQWLGSLDSVESKTSSIVTTGWTVVAKKKKG